MYLKIGKHNVVMLKYRQLGRPIIWIFCFKKTLQPVVLISSLKLNLLSLKKSLYSGILYNMKELMRQPAIEFELCLLQ